jgi:hypothetical protein
VLVSYGEIGPARLVGRRPHDGFGLPEIATLGGLGEAARLPSILPPTQPRGRHEDDRAHQADQDEIDAGDQQHPKPHLGRPAGDRGADGDDPSSPVGAAAYGILLDVPSTEAKLRKAWETWTVDRRHAVVAAVLPAVVVGPARRGKRFDADRVTPSGGSDTRVLPARVHRSYSRPDPTA